MPLITPSSFCCFRSFVFITPCLPITLLRGQWIALSVQRAVCLLEGQSHHFCWNWVHAFGVEGLVALMGWSTLLHTSVEYWQDWGCRKGSRSKWGRSASAVQLALRQPRSHSYSALSSLHRLPLLTRLIAFSQSRGYVFDESIKTLCIAKQAEPKSHQGHGVLHCVFSALCCISLLSGPHYLQWPLTQRCLNTVTNIEEIHTDNYFIWRDGSIKATVQLYIKLKK